jgi:AcrR family transcriptional regulator
LPEITLSFEARPRNAAATRQAILDAATARFEREGYDDVGVRDIARDAGVDPALISRYFGSKEDLFDEVLNVCMAGSDLMDGPREDFGRRMAHEVVFGPSKGDAKMKGLLIMLRSIGSAKAAEVIRRSSQRCFYGPFAEWLGDPDAAVRARLAGGLMMGVSLSREISGGFDLSPEECESLCSRLAAALQDLVDH